jgi:hypothetical protein
MNKALWCAKLLIIKVRYVGYKQTTEGVIDISQIYARRIGNPPAYLSSTLAIFLGPRIS